MKNANCKLQIANWGRCRRGFTLVELLIVMLIIAILVLLAWGALAGVAEQAKEKRTRSIVMKLDQLIMQRYDGYRTRPLPIRIGAGTRPKSESFTDSNNNGFWNVGEPEQNSNGIGERGAAFYRLMSLRELMRMELPDRRSDIINYTVAGYPMESTATGMPLAALQRTYYRKALAVLGGSLTNTAPLANWTEQHQGAECLYLIVSTMHDGDKNALDFFMPGEIGDVDNDGMREILDGWGNPIEFLRWAPGFRNDPGGDLAWGVAGVDDDGNGTIDDYSELGMDSSDIVRATMQRPDLRDPFDPIREDARMTFALRPLIFSAGADKSYDVATDFAPVSLRYAFPDSPPFPANSARSPNDPYIVSGGASPQLGQTFDIDADGEEWADNITNHYSPTNDP
jgi:prepilin-type N-terminal cleavage/methylation domain-containing protein